MKRTICLAFFILSGCTPLVVKTTADVTPATPKACLVDQPVMSVQNRTRAAAELARLGSGSASELFLSDYINYRAAIRKACEK